MSKRTEIDIFTVDSFSEDAFGGNPAAVCLLPASLDLSDELQQKIAAEMNISETCFIKLTNMNAEGEPPRYNLRWFTPTNEVPLCGHATLAAAHVAFEQGVVKGNIVQFMTLSGVLEILKRDDGQMRMDLPQGIPVPVSLSSELDDLLHEKVNLPKETKIKEVEFCAKTRKLLVEIESPQGGNVGTLTKLDVKTSVLHTLKLEGLDVRGVIVTTAPIPEDKDYFEKYDFVSRYFAPWNGIPEDPVTGSAHTVLFVYWGKKIKREEGLRARQASKRGGDLLLLDGGEEGEGGKRVHVYGKAVSVLKGKFVC